MDASYRDISSVGRSPTAQEKPVKFRRRSTAADHDLAAAITDWTICGAGQAGEALPVRRRSSPADRLLKTTVSPAEV